MLLATYKIRVAMIMKFQEIVGMKYIFKFIQNCKNASTLDVVTKLYELVFFILIPYARR